MRYEVSKVLTKNQVMDLVFGNNAQPGKILGRHFVNEGQVIAAYHPDAVAMTVLLEDGTEYEMDAVERLPLFAVYLPTRDLFEYKISMKFRDGNIFVSRDPYSFKNQITKEEEEQFSAGLWTDSYKKMGAHTMTIDGVEGVYFAVWAPSARRVSIVGDFNFWNGMLCPMNRLEDSGIFELFLPGLPESFKYKYEIKLWDGSVKQKLDPCGQFNLTKSGDASRLICERDYVWKDQQWMQQRKERMQSHKYISIADYTKIPLSQKLVLECPSGFTHVLLGGVDYESDTSSWTDSGVYSLPFEGMTPDQVKQSIDILHEKGIGVLVKCNFGYYRNGDSGLVQFDGTSLYGFSDERKDFNEEHNKYRFCYTKEEVKGYLFSAMKMWLDEYHLDGFLFLNQSEILFPEWKYDGQELAYRKCSVDFFEQAYKMLKNIDSGILVLGDAVNSGHLQKEMIYGRTIFDYYVDPRINNALEQYLGSEGMERKSLFYQIIRPFCHRGVELSVTILNEIASHAFSMEEQKMVAALLLGLPGIKRIHQFSDMSSEMLTYQNRLLDTIGKYEALQDSGYGMRYFEWIDNSNPDTEIISFLRKSSAGEKLLFVTNLGNVERGAYIVGVPENVPCELVFDSRTDEIEENAYLYPQEKGMDLRDYSITVSVKAFQTLIFRLLCEEERGEEE